MESVSLTIDDALQKNGAELNMAMVNLDRWLAQTPGGPSSDFATFRQMKQDIKLLRLKRNELVDMKKEYEKTMTFQTVSPMGNLSVPEKFSKCRSSRLPDERLGNKLGERAGNKLSRG